MRKEGGKKRGREDDGRLDPHNVFDRWTPMDIPILATRKVL